MPRIPSDSYVPTMDANLTGFRVDTSVLSPELASIPAQQEGRLAGAMMSAGSATMNIANDMQDQINQTEKQNFVNKLAQFKGVLADDPKNGYLARTGEAAFKPDDQGRTVSDIYQEKFKAYADDLAAGLGNDRQRLMVAPHTADIALSIQHETQKHALTQFKSYQASTLNGQFKLAADDAERNWDQMGDPNGTLTKSLNNAQAAVANAGMLQGKAPQEIAADIKAAASTIHMRVLSAALQANNPTSANMYFQAHRDPKIDDQGNMVDGGMTASDILHFNTAMNHTINNSVAMQVVGATMQKYSSQIAPTSMDGLSNIVRSIESGGKDFKDDGVTPITSVKGAKYAMQVMPATAKDPGFGIQPAANDSPAEYNRVGQQLLGKMVEKYGDVPRAMAAYNAGPGAVDASVKKNGANWLAAMPQETQDYVRKGTQQFYAGQGPTPLPTEQEFTADAMSKLGPNPRPELVQLVQQHSEHQFGVLTKSRQQQANQAVDNLFRGVIDSGGDFSQVDPRLKMAVSQLAPGKYDDAVLMAKRVSEGNTGKPVELNQEAQNTSIFHPERLGAMTDNDFLKWQVDNFPKEQWASVAKRRDDFMNDKIDMSADGVNHKTLDRVLKERMLNIDIDPAKATKDPKTKFQVNAIQSYISQGVIDQQKQLGRRMSEDEMTKFVDTTFAKDQSFSNKFLGMEYSTGSRPLMKAGVNDIPGDAYKGIKQALIDRGQKAPTDTDILKTYWRVYK